jgi:hypothetical protein
MTQSEAGKFNLGNASVDAEPQNTLRVALPCSDAVEVPRNKKEVGQVTLSTIADVSVAATAAMRSVSNAPGRIRWLSIVGFLFFIYVVTCAVSVYYFKAEPWRRAFLLPLFPVVVATLAFWRRQSWKFRTRNLRFRLRILEDALASLGYETASAANAARANLIGLRLANPQVPRGGHLEEIEAAIKRLDAAVEKSKHSQK